MLGALGLSGYIMADTFFVANRLGSDGLAALNLAIPIFRLINGLGILLGIGGATRYSICRYQGDEGRANRTFTLALTAALILGTLLALLGAFGARPVALLLGGNADTLPLCTVYLRTVLLFSPCFLLNHVMVCFVRNDGNPKLAMAAMLTGSLGNIALDYLFLYPLNMGIFGAALATGTAPVIGLCLSSFHSLTGRNQFKLARPASPVRSLADVAGLGSAAFLNEFTSCMVLALIAQFAAHPLVDLFNRDGDPALARMAVDGLRIYFWGFLCAGPNIITAAFLGAAEQPRASFLLSLFRGGVGIALLVLLLAWLLGMTGIWLAFPAAELFTLLLGLGAARRLIGPPSH